MTPALNKYPGVGKKKKKPFMFIFMSIASQTGASAPHGPSEIQAPPM